MNVKTGVTNHMSYLTVRNEERVTWELVRYLY